MKDKLKMRVEGGVIQKYMRSEFFVSAAAIPLWDPSPGVNSPKGIKNRNICVGDVGFFTPDGGFEVLFNAFLSYDANVDDGFDPPDGFEPYGPVDFCEQVSKITRVYSSSYNSCRGDFKRDAEIPQHPERLAPSSGFWPKSAHFDTFLIAGSTSHHITYSKKRPGTVSDRVPFLIFQMVLGGTKFSFERF